MSETEIIAPMRLPDICRADRLLLRDHLHPILDEIPVSLNNANGRPAAILVGVQWRTDGWYVIMTERAAHLANHAGQISFPGGKVDKDDENLTVAALREAEEEIGLQRSAVEIVGALDPVISPAGFVVQPIVGIVQGDAVLQAAPDEVEKLLILPLAHVLNPVHHRQDSYIRHGEHRAFWVIDHPDHYLWGLSARVLVDLANRISG